MSDHIQATINDLQTKLRQQESQVAKTKSVINQLCEVAGLKPIYNVDEPDSVSPSNLAIQSDQFYGQPLASAVRAILQIRKARSEGPATINEIFESLEVGGFAFETKIVDNAKRNLRISVSKNTGMFHKLPNGKVGLLEWYPNAKQQRRKSMSGSDHTSDEDEDEGGSS